MTTKNPPEKVETVMEMASTSKLIPPGDIQERKAQNRRTTASTEIREPETKDTITRLDTGQRTERRTRKVWTKEEDEALLAVLDNCDTTKTIKWKDVADALDSGRNGKQCRDRWMNKLRPGLNKNKWTRDEESLLADMYEAFGPKWSAMAKIFRNRSESDVKNKWYSQMRSETRIRQKESADHPTTSRSSDVENQPTTHEENRERSHHSTTAHQTLDISEHGAEFEAG